MSDPDDAAAPRPELTPERIRQILAESAKGAAELDRQLRDVFRLTPAQASLVLD